MGARALRLVRALPNHSLLDRLVRGRAWIPVLGVLLVGLVAMQVEILKLGTSLGRSLQRTTSLQSQDESLQASVASLADDQRIERLAAGMGMVMPTPGMLTFVSAGTGGQLGKALANIHAPDPSGFALQLADLVARAALITPTTASTTAATPAGTANQPPTTQSAPTMPAGTAQSGTTSTGAAAGSQVGPGQGVVSSGTPSMASPAQPTAPPTDTGPAGTSGATGPAVAAPVLGGGAGTASGAAALPSTPQSSAPTGG